MPTRPYPPQPTEYPSADAWRAEAVRRFGPDPLGWRFVCPCCGHVVSVRDYKAAGAPQGAYGFSCIGRYLGGGRDAFGAGAGPCNYTTGGLFNLSPIKVTEGKETYSYFAFDAPESSDVAS